MEATVLLRLDYETHEHAYEHISQRLCHKRQFKHNAERELTGHQMTLELT